MLARRRKPQRQQRAIPKSFPKTVPAPVTGWNTRDSLDAMPPTDAAVLDNWFPSTGKVSVRNGYTDHGATTMGGSNIDTLAEYHSGTTRHLIACANGNIYNATSSGAATSLGSGFTINNWQTQNFNGRLFLVNGTDAPQDWDGSTLTATAWTGPSSINDLIFVKAFKSRLYFVEENSQSFWYAGVNAVTGALTEFPLSRVGQFGGNLLTIGTWSRDSGDGPDDYIAFVMTSGDVIVYAGTDPSSASTWALIGVYDIGTPMDIRGTLKHGGDLQILTQNDVVSLNEIISSADGEFGSATKLSGAITAASTNAGVFGWQAIRYLKGNMIIYNVPIGSDEYDQYVVNALTGAVCRFTDIPARCWTMYNSSLYFGSTDGLIYQFDSANTDNGSAIVADSLQAWTDFGLSYDKVLTAIRPIIQSDGTVTYSIGVGFDFASPAVPPAVTTSSTDAIWDVALWDQAAWQAETVTDSGWRLAKGKGSKLAVRLRVSSSQNISWLSTSFRLKQALGL